jgi:hypothetical protein
MCGCVARHIFTQGIYSSSIYVPLANKLWCFSLHQEEAWVTRNKWHSRERGSMSRSQQVTFGENIVHPYMCHLQKKKKPCSLELIISTYQPWYNVFFPQQNSISRLISRRNHQPNRSWVHYYNNFNEGGCFGFTEAVVLPASVLRSQLIGP